MRFSGASKALLILGALVGAAAGLALAFGLRLDQLPPWMITVGMYKLAFLAAAGLLVAGAMLGRAAKNKSGRFDGPAEVAAARSALRSSAREATDQTAAEPDRIPRGRHDRDHGR